jgi:hypothetical protein
MSVPTESPRRLWVIACLATIAAGVLLVTPLLLMGPSAPDDDSYVDGPVIATGGGRQSWPLAGVTGQLTMERGCLLLAGSPVYWPNGTSWDATTREVVFSDGTRLGVGSILSGGGGAHSTTDLDAQPKTTAVAATLAPRRVALQHGIPSAWRAEMLTQEAELELPSKDALRASIVVVRSLTANRRQIGVPRRQTPYDINLARWRTSVSPSPEG